MGCKVAGCERKHKGRGYCDAHLKKLKQYGDPLGGPRKEYRKPKKTLQELKDDLYSQIRIVHYPGRDRPCWEWTGSFMKGQDGEDTYGAYYFKPKGGKPYHTAPRVSMYIKCGGKDWGDLFVLHKCNNQKCINPDCLYLDTQGQNVLDSIDDQNNVCQGKPALSRDVIERNQNFAKKHEHTYGFKSRYARRLEKVLDRSASTIRTILARDTFHGKNTFLQSRYVRRG